MNSVFGVCSMNPIYLFALCSIELFTTENAYDLVTSSRPHTHNTPKVSATIHTFVVYSGRHTSVLLLLFSAEVEDNTIEQRLKSLLEMWHSFSFYLNHKSI